MTFIFERCDNTPLTERKVYLHLFILHLYRTIYSRDLYKKQYDFSKIL